jgi:competence protein ComEA
MVDSRTKRPQLKSRVHEIIPRNLARIRLTMKLHTAFFLRAGLLFAVTTVAASAQQMADGSDKNLFVKTCSQCHEIDRVMSQRQDKAGWEATINKMKGYGMQADEADLKRIIGYLSVNLPAETVAKLNINTATRIEFESALSLKRSVATAIIEYREKNGPFKSIDDLKKVPGVDPAKIDEKKSSLSL